LGICIYLKNLYSLSFKRIDVAFKRLEAFYLRVCGRRAGARHIYIDLMRVALGGVPEQPRHRAPAADSSREFGTYTQALNALSTEFQGPDPDEDDARSEDSDMTDVPDTYAEEPAEADAPADEAPADEAHADEAPPDKAPADEELAEEENEAYAAVRSWLYQQHRVGDTIDICNAGAEYVPARSVSPVRVDTHA